MCETKPTAKPFTSVIRAQTQIGIEISMKHPAMGLLTENQVDIAVHKVVHELANPDEFATFLANAIYTEVIPPDLRLQLLDVCRQNLRAYAKQVLSMSQQPQTQKEPR